MRERLQVRADRLERENDALRDELASASNGHRAASVASRQRGHSKRQGSLTTSATVLSQPARRSWRCGCY